MTFIQSQKFKDRAGLIAALVLAIACLAAAIYHIRIIVDLQQHGVSTQAIVVDIKHGARNSSWAIYQYSLPDGREIVAKDLFQQYIKQVDRGESVRVLYHRQHVTRVTADLGWWIWQAPVIFLSGFILLAILVDCIWRHRSA